MRWLFGAILLVLAVGSGVVFGPTIVRTLHLDSVMPPTDASKAVEPTPDGGSAQETANATPPAERITVTEAPDKGQGNSCAKVFVVVNNTKFRFAAGYSWADGVGNSGAADFMTAHSMGAIAMQSQLFDTQRPCNKGWASMRIDSCFLENHTDYECRQLLDIRLTQQGASSTSKYLEDGMSAMKAKDYPRAVAEYDKFVAANPSLCPAYELRAMAKFLAGDWVGAISDSSQALKSGEGSHPSCNDHRIQAGALFTRGAAKIRAGDTLGGEKDLEAARQLDPAEEQALAKDGIHP